MAKAKGTTVVDFTDVDTSGGRIRVPEDDYHVKVAQVRQAEAKSSGNAMLVWDFEFMKGKHKGQVIRDRTVLTKKSLWKLKSLLEAMGVNVPSKKVALKLSRYEDMELGITVVDDDEYEGRVASKVADYIPLDVLEGEDEEDEDVEDEDLEDEEDEDEEEPAPKKSKKGKKGKKGKKSKKVDDEEEIEDLDLDEI